MPLKCTTIEKAIERYGAIDFASKHWAQQHTWIVMYQVPPFSFPNLHVMDTPIRCEHIAINKDMYDPLDQALRAVIKAGLQNELRTFDGCLNIRPVRGTLHAPSTHSYGLGIDWNQATNQMGSVLHTDFTKEFVKCFTDQGFDWGGDFRHRKDPMHFSYAWE